MDDVVLKFDPKDSGSKNRILNVTLKARSEDYVKLPTTCKEHGLISRREIIPGIYMPESLSREIECACITSIVNTLEEDVTIDAPFVELEEIEEPIQSEAMIFARLSKLRKELRTDTLSRICVTTPVSENEDNKPTVSQEDKARTLKEMHENLTGGHLEMNRTYV
jgi:hypothetical protein